MALDDTKIQEVLNNYNLTSEEMVQFNRERPNDGFADEAALRSYITKMRRENALKTAEKDAGDIAFDELQVAWETVKDAKEGDLLNAKKALEEKSKAAVAEAKAENLSMENAPELSEWLKINNTLKDKDSSRNKVLQDSLDEFYRNYDQEWKLENVNKNRAAEIIKLQQDMISTFKDLDPFADDATSRAQFKETIDFYNKLKLVGENGQLVTKDEKSQFVGQMVGLAKLEAATYLSTQEGFAQLSPQEKNQQFLEAFKSYLEQGAVSIMVADATSKMDPNQAGNLNEEQLREKFTAAFRQSATQSEPVSYKVAEAAYGGRLNTIKHINKRIAQKTEKRGFFGFSKLKEKWNKFAERNPKTAMALKMAGNFGLTIGMNALGGGVGLAALGVYRTYNAVRKAREVCGSYKAIFKNPSQMLNIASSASTVVFGAWSGIAGGLDANGIIGQGINHGFGETLNSMSDNISQGVSAMWNKITGNSADVASDSSFWEGLKKTPQRIINNLTVTGENAPHSLKRITNLLVSVSRGIDGSIKKAKEAKGKTWKEKALAWSGAVLTMVGLSATDASLEHHGSSNHVGHEGTGNGNHNGSNPSDEITPAPKSFNEIFQSENKEHLERAVNAAPDTVLKHLKAEGIFAQDTKFMSSPKLMAEINKYYATHPEANPQALADYVNANQNQFIHDMKVSNAEQDARRAAIQAAKERLQGVYHDGDTPVNPTEGNPTEDYVYDPLTDSYSLPGNASDDEYTYSENQAEEPVKEIQSDKDYAYDPLTDSYSMPDDASGDGHDVVESPAENAEQTENTKSDVAKETNTNDAPVIKAKQLTLQDAESLGKGHLVIVGDKWGNRQFVGCDENGTPFRITAIKQNVSEEFRKTMMESGEKVNEYKYIVDVSENSSLYNQLYPKDPSVSDEILRKQSEIAQETYARNIFGKIDGRTLIQDRDEELVNYNLQNGEVASDVMSHINSDVFNIINSEGNGTTSVLVNENTVEQTTPSTEETRAETKPLENSAVIKAVNYDFVNANNWEYRLDQIPASDHFPKEVWKAVEEKTYVDPVTHKIVCGGTVGTLEGNVEMDERIRLMRLARSHNIYQAISAKQADGTNLTANEEKFLVEHQKALGEHNLKIDKEGKVVFDDEKFREKLGLHDKKSVKIFTDEQKKMGIWAGRDNPLPYKFSWNSYFKNGHAR